MTTTYKMAGLNFMLMSNNRINVDETSHQSTEMPTLSKIKIQEIDTAENVQRNTKDDDKNKNNFNSVNSK